MTKIKTFPVNEIYYSPQGEGVRSGTMNVFVRFAGCNQRCLVKTHGFDCDTEFVSNRPMTAMGILDACEKLWPLHSRHGDDTPWVIWTGGEPMLSLDDDLVALFTEAGWKQAIETNGSRKVPDGIDWICVSPKVAEHAIKQLEAHEVKYVRAFGQGIPKPVVNADNYLISPAFTPEGVPDQGALDWCLRLVAENPPWRLSMQQHKGWGVR